MSDQTPAHGLGVWPARLSWLALAGLVEPATAQALSGRSTAVAVTGAALAWGLWTVALVATLVPRTTSATVYRVIAPGALVVAGWAAASGAGGVAAAVALAGAVLAVAVAFHPATGDVFIDGSSYGPERRLALRPPAGLLLGPIPLAWALAFAGFVAGPLLLAARSWIVGAALVAVGWPVAWLAVGRLHTLARRWIVLVPAGLVLHDPLQLADAALFARRSIVSIAPARIDNPALDLSGAAPGLALQVTFDEPQELSIRRGGRNHPADTVAVEALLCTPTRPARLLDAAAEQRLPTG
ncbi:MAG: hypothetical protein ABI276_00135 [Acidimicrobiales bacterium]